MKTRAFSKSVDLERRAALVRMAQTGAGAVVTISGMSLLIQACGSDASDGGDTGGSDSSSCESAMPETPVACTNDTVLKAREYGGPHTHTPVLTMTALSSAVSGSTPTLRVEFSMTQLDGTPTDHLHWYDFSLDELTQLQNGEMVCVDIPIANGGQSVGVERDDDKHSHRFKVQCISA